MTLTPLDWNDEQIAKYVEQSQSFDDGQEVAGYSEALLQSIRLGEVAIERRTFGFAIIHRVLKVAPGIRPRTRVLSHFHVEVIEVFRGRATHAESSNFFNEIIEKYGTVADLRGECVGLARARLFRRYGCSCTEKQKESGMYDVVLRKKPSSPTPRSTGL
jgi:hypothetical protein